MEIPRPPKSKFDSGDLVYATIPLGGKLSNCFTGKVIRAWWARAWPYTGTGWEWHYMVVHTKGRYEKSNMKLRTGVAEQHLMLINKATI